MSEQNVEQIIQAMTRAPEPACEVITIERSGAETILRHLEDTNALPEHVAFLRSQLAEPKVELWAVHSVGPGEVYPSLSKEHAEREAQELVELGRKMKAERIERGESVEHWHDWVINVIPSPWEPAEHFQILAEETIEHRDSLLAQETSEAPAPVDDDDENPLLLQPLVQWDAEEGVSLSHHQWDSIYQHAFELGGTEGGEYLLEPRDISELISFALVEMGFPHPEVDTAQQAECKTCSGVGLVGRNPDHGEPCPDCNTPAAEHWHELLSSPVAHRAQQGGAA